MVDPSKADYVGSLDRPSAAIQSTHNHPNLNPTHPPNLNQSASISRQCLHTGRLCSAVVSFGPGLAFGVIQSLRRSLSGSTGYLWALFSVRAHLARGSSSDQSVDVQSVPVASNRDRWWWSVFPWSVVVVFTGRARTVDRGPGLNVSECIG